MRGNKYRDVFLVVVTCAALGYWSSSNDKKSQPIDKAGEAPPTTILASESPVQITAAPVGPPTDSSKISLRDVSIEGIRLGMSRPQVIKLWGTCDTGTTTQGSISEEILTQSAPRRDAFISPQGVVRSILGETLEYQGHRLRPGASLVDLTIVFGQPEVYEGETPPPKTGTWSYLDGAIQAHYSLEIERSKGGTPKVYLYELMTIRK